MKINPCLIFLLLLGHVIFAQGENDRKVYYDSLWSETEKDDYVYYRIIKDYNTTKDEYEVTDYFRSGKVQMTGQFADREAQIKVGHFVFFYENGQKYSEAHFEKGIKPNTYLPVKSFNSWYDDGSKKLEAEYVPCENPSCSEFKVVNYWGRDGKQLAKDGNGIYEEDDKTFRQSGPIVNGVKQGEWIGKGVKKQKAFSFKDQFDKGDLVSGVMTDTLGVAYPYKQIVVPPKPRKGLEHFYKFVAKKFTFPKGRDSENGRIVIGFIIDKNGDATELKVIRSMDEDFDNEAMRVIQAYPDWEPGKYRGMDSRTQYSIPIVIKSE